MAGNANSGTHRSSKIAGALRRALNARDMRKGDGATLQELADKLIDDALNAETPAARLSAFREIADRLDGKPTENVNINPQKSVKEMSLPELLQFIHECRDEITSIRAGARGSGEAGESTASGADTVH